MLSVADADGEADGAADCAGAGEADGSDSLADEAGDGFADVSGSVSSGSIVLWPSPGARFPDPRQIRFARVRATP